MQTISETKTLQDLAIRHTKISIKGLRALSPLRLTGLSVAGNSLFHRDVQLIEILVDIKDFDMTFL